MPNPNIPGEGEPDPEMRRSLIEYSPGTVIGLTNTVRRISDQLFPDRTDNSMYLKMYEEIAEVIRSGGNADEVADLFILLLDYASRHEVDVTSAVLTKLEVLMSRSWVQCEGVYRHV